MAKAKGIIAETQLDNRRGIVVSVIVKDGILRLGENIATQSARGKIKYLENFLGEKVNALEPSAPALILGFESSPRIGEEFSTGEMIVASAKIPMKAILKAPSTKAEEGVKKIKIILKADNAGALEALSDVIKIHSVNQRIR